MPGTASLRKSGGKDDDEKKAVEKSKLGIMREKRTDRTFFVKRLKEIDSKLYDAKQALEIARSSGSLSSHCTADHPTESTFVAAKKYLLLEERMGNQRYKHEFIPEKRPRRYE